MKLGEIAHVSRGIVTGDREVFVMTREEARKRGIESFVHPIVDGAREMPNAGRPVISDKADRLVVLLATADDIARVPALAAYLGDKKPKVSSFKPSPIVATYVGVPRFAANPENLVVLNSLYCVRPKQQLSAQELRELVQRLNEASAKLPIDKFTARRTPSEFNALVI